MKVKSEEKDWFINFGKKKSRLFWNSALVLFWSPNCWFEHPIFRKRWDSILGATNQSISRDFRLHGRPYYHDHTRIGQRTGALRSFGIFTTNVRTKYYYYYLKHQLSEFYSTYSKEDTTSMLHFRDNGLPGTSFWEMEFRKIYFDRIEMGCFRTD